MKHVLVYGMTDNPGGIETYLLNFFERVQGEAVHLDFISDFPAVAHSDRLTARGAKLYFFPAKSKDLWGHLKGMWKLLRAHKEYKTVYFNILDAGAAVTMLPVFLLGRRIVVHSHNGSTDKVRLHKLCRPFLKLMARECVACSKTAAQFMFGKRKALVIPNAIDAAKYAYQEDARRAKREELALGQRPVLCHVGRISHQKNPLGLIDIFEVVRSARPDVLLMSVGTGEMEEEFSEYIRLKKLEDSVIRLGVRKDVPELLQAADLFLFPSFYEGLPISLLEAQAAGLPCVISDVISEESVVTDLVCPVSLQEPAEAWAKRVLERLEHPRKNTYLDLVKAGFDISCCNDHDRKLMEKF